MVYQKTITTLHQTYINSLLQTKLQLSKGLIYKLNIYFPPGPSGLVGVSIYENGTPIYPLDNSEYFIGDNIMYSFDDIKYVKVPPYEFDIYTYNIDDIYDHICIVQIGLLTDDELQFKYNPYSFIDILNKYNELQVIDNNNKKNETIKQFITNNKRL